MRKSFVPILALLEAGAKDHTHPAEDIVFRLDKLNFLINRFI